MSLASSALANDVDPNDKYAFSDDGSDDGSIPLNPAAEALLDRSTALLEEIESFQRSLRRSGLEKSVELRLFLSQVKSEHRCLQGLTLECPDSTKSRHGVHASNLPYLEAVWGHAKKTTGITALCKSFSYAEPGVQNARGKKKKASVTVDIVAQNGLQWIKISLLTPRRLLFELAKAGWEEAADFSDDEDAPSSLDPATTTTLATSSTSLSNLADNLLTAARQTRVQYLHPTITFILPHLPPTTPEITAFLTTLQAKGITISTPTTLLPAPSIEDLVSTLTSPLSRRAIPLSTPVNLDTTILLALISDISHHASVEVEPRMHPAILRQLDMEKERPMLPGHLLPVLEGRDMITCVSARERFEEIVEIVASDTERERARLLLSHPDDDTTPETRTGRMQELSTHPCGALKLPVVTVPDHSLVSTDPSEFQQVAGKLSSVNRGAFMTGWARGLTTVTSNRAVAKMVESACCAEELGVEVVGPDVFVVESARSLVGKGKMICDVVAER